MARTSTKKVQPITETIGVAKIEVNLPRIPTIGACKVWGKEEAAQIRQSLKEADTFLSNEHYRRLGEALGDQNARDLQAEATFQEEYALLHQTVLDTMEGRLKEIVILGCGRAMLQHFPKSPLGLLHFGNHGLQIGLFRRPNTGEKALTIDLPVGTLARWEWTTLLSPIPGGNDLIAALRPISDAAHETLRREDERMAARRLEGLKGQGSSFADVMKAGRGRTACHIPALRTAPECWLDLTIGNNQIRINWVGGGNAFQQSLAGVAIPFGAIETGRFTFNTRQSLGDKVRRAEYLLVSLLDALQFAGVKQQKPSKPVATTPARKPTSKPPQKLVSSRPAKPTAATDAPSTMAQKLAAALGVPVPAPSSEVPVSETAPSEPVSATPAEK